MKKIPKFKIVDDDETDPAGVYEYAYSYPQAIMLRQKWATILHPLCIDLDDYDGSVPVFIEKVSEEEGKKVAEEKDKWKKIAKEKNK